MLPFRTGITPQVLAALILTMNERAAGGVSDPHHGHDAPLALSTSPHGCLILLVDSPGGGWMRHFGSRKTTLTSHVAMAGAVHIPLPAVSVRATVPCGFLRHYTGLNGRQRFRGLLNFHLKGF